MKLRYEYSPELTKIHSIADAYFDWFTADISDYPFPDLIESWIAETRAYFNFGFFPTKDQDDLTALYRSIRDHDYMTGEGSKDKNYADFKKKYALFLTKLRRLERDCQKESLGIDCLTGLKNRFAIRPDLEKEMDRLARKGKPFSFAVARIDEFDRIEKNLDEADLKKLIQKLTVLVQNSLRSFDDAYRSTRSEFFMTLKQADNIGGVAALERLRRAMQREGLSVMIDGQEELVSLSSCVSEPMPNDKVDDLLDNLRAEIQRCEKEPGGTVLEYYEISPLQRFVREEG